MKTEEESTSFPGSLFFSPKAFGGKKRDPGNDVEGLLKRSDITQLIHSSFLVQIYKTVSFSITSSSANDEFSDSIWILFCDKSPFLRHINMSKIKSPRNSMPPAEKKAA